MRITPERYLQQTAHYSFNIPRECDRRYVGKTGRPLAVRLLEHRCNLKECLLEKSKLAQNAYEGHEAGWAEARTLETESKFNGYILVYMCI
jgi:hypothetical protein